MQTPEFPPLCDSEQSAFPSLGTEQGGMLRLQHLEGIHRPGASKRIWNQIPHFSSGSLNLSLTWSCPTAHSPKPAWPSVPGWQSPSAVCSQTTWDQPSSLLAYFSISFAHKGPTYKARSCPGQLGNHLSLFNKRFAKYVIQMRGILPHFSSTASLTPKISTLPNRRNGILAQYNSQ